MDYICVPHDVLDKCCYFNVNKHSLHGFLGEQSRPPDHSVLITEFKSGNPDKTRYSLIRIPAGFLTSERSRQAIGNITLVLKQLGKTKNK